MPVGHLTFSSVFLSYKNEGLSIKILFFEIELSHLEKWLILSLFF